MMDNRCGFYIKHINDVLQRDCNNSLKAVGLTMSQLTVLHQLERSTSGEMTLKELEKQLQVAQSTAAGIISRLEQKGFVALRTDPEDRRCKRIYVLEKGQQCHELMHQTILKNEQRMTEGFTDEERRIFSELLQRAIRNMGGDPTPRRCKEEERE